MLPQLKTKSPPRPFVRKPTPVILILYFFCIILLPPKIDTPIRDH